MTKDNNDTKDHNDKKNNDKQRITYILITFGRCFVTDELPLAGAKTWGKNSTFIKFIEFLSLNCCAKKVNIVTYEMLCLF